MPKDREQNLNYRDKFIKGMLAKCNENKQSLNDWEVSFITDVEQKVNAGVLISSRTYNTLVDITDRI